MRGKGSAATGAIGHDLKALIKKTLVEDLLKRPPLGLDKAVVIGNVGVVHISPEANGAREILPHLLIFPNRLLAVTDEGLKSVALDLILSVDSKLLLNLKLYGKTVSIPACLTENSLALHRLVSRDHILDNAGKNVTDVGLSVCGRRAVEEGEVLAILADVNTSLKHAIFLPERARCLFSFNKV